MSSRFQFRPITNLRKDEKCTGCNGEICPTVYGQFTEFIYDTITDKAYHGDCTPGWPDKSKADFNSPHRYDEYR